MKKIFFMLYLWLLVSGLWAQQGSDPQLFTGSTALQDAEAQGADIHLQVGSPIHYGHYEFADGTTLSLRFPWDVSYIPLTFSTEFFEVSKGYFSEKILINWAIQSNANKIDQIKIYRRLFEESNLDDVANYVLVATLSTDTYSYEDTNIQGGVLYEYKIEASGLSSIPKKYVTYITGVGYRNPTGVVTGNISFDGGSPVKDVVVRADPQGADLAAFGSSLLFTNASLLSIPLKNKELNEAITLQAWVKLEENSTASLFKLQDNQRTTDEIWISYATSPTNLVITVAHSNGLSKSFTIADYYPSGNLDGRGDDLFKSFADPDLPQTNFSENFAHLTIALENGEAPIFYLNGRNIDENYMSTLPEGAVSIPSIVTSGTYIFGGFETADVVVAEGLQGNIDEIRFWNKALDETRIRTDFKRYLGGSEANLISYLRCDENAGRYAYDISKAGFEFNRNHARIFNGTWNTEKPRASQLGILGVTDSLGNYIISAIPFAGVGESYTITPMFGVHQFEPAQKLMFIGVGAQVINKVDFNDISSFNFLGVAYYTTTGVFAPIGPVDNVTSVEHSGYNQYSVIIDGNEQLISKGAYRYDQLDPDNPVLYEIPKVYSEGAFVYIDGRIVLDKDSKPVETDEQGFFKIQVPIGYHYIEVRKDKHVFAHEGRFPAAREDGDDLFEFFEHQESAVTFLDTTRVFLVGRVVGGILEAEKSIGFGYDGPRQETYVDADGIEETVDISSINNIGQATITLNYLPFGGTPGIGELEHTFNTHPETGEYKISLLPLIYTIDQSNGIQISSNPEIQLLEANETVHLSEAKSPILSDFTDSSGQQVYSDPYHFVKSFTHRSTPVLKVLSQYSDPNVDVTTYDSFGTPADPIEVSTDGFAYRVYRQFHYYGIQLQTFEEYVNHDAGPGNEQFDQVPITDGEFNITNNLALPDSEVLEVDPVDPSISSYQFEGGIPSISPPFARTIDIKYRVNGIDYDARNYDKEGIILGGQPDGSQTFVTEAPQVPDIILRDPPGSNSYASIKEGTKLSFVDKGNVVFKQSQSYSALLLLGWTFKGNTPVVVENKTLNNRSIGLSLDVNSSYGENLSKTYTFNQTISTSSDPDFVGSEGDLYIGNAKNYFFGSFDNVQPSFEQIGDNPSLVLTNEAGDSIHISKQKAMYFSEEPSPTFFIYSQKHILNTLIPELEEFIKGIDDGIILEDTAAGVQNKDFYEEQIRLWKRVIQDNEMAKYRALHDRENLRSQIQSNIQKAADKYSGFLLAIDAEGALADVSILYSFTGIQTLASVRAFMNDKINFLEQMQVSVENEFERNVSFDAGVGKYTQSSTIAVAQEKTRHINFTSKVTLNLEQGFKLNDNGFVIKAGWSPSHTLNAALSNRKDTTTTIEYTLDDGDGSDFLSVDVINSFDGNGPIFSTVGGRTSCPYEGSDSTHFYNHAQFIADSTGVYEGGELISFATQRVDVPKISVEVASLTDVPEERPAEFTLILENNSVTEEDASFLLYVDNTTNPNNAIFNIAPGGSVVKVPYGEWIEYALTLEKSISDVYAYENIDIILRSKCEGSIKDIVTVSAVFNPSCTAVEIDGPLNNWVFNAGDAYNVDNSTNPLSITMFGYDRAYSGFENFRLEYRKSTSSSWTRLQNYYNTQELLDAAIDQGEDQGTLITENTTGFPWDIGALGLSDGQYEIRVASSCANGTVYFSEAIPGKVDLNVPVQFGTPSPTDGVLGAGEDLRLQFNEDILYSSALSKIEIKGETNQQEINHNISIHFEGTDGTVAIEKPNIVSGDFTLEFWLQDQTTGSGVLFNQADALLVTLNNGVMEWTFGGQTMTKPVATDKDFHHYTLTYSVGNERMSIYQDDQNLGTLDGVAGLSQRSDNPLIIGGNTFIGNLHDLRFWSKSLTLSEAYAAQFNELMGSERDLIGYWPMNEGTGAYTKDRARFKHAAIHAEWDIKPKGTAYEFEGSQYLVLDKVGFVQLTDLMDVTLSFWLKTDKVQKGTIFSNGRGNEEDIVQSNGKRNKWAVTLEDGILYLNSEGIQYTLSSTNLADDNWHHVSIILRRIGSLKTYIDAALESSQPVSEIGGLSGNKIWIGARGFINNSLEETIDEVFSGKIDELRLWNMARATEQTDRDRFNEVDFNTTGMMLYARMNEPDPVTGNGPKYYHMDANEIVLPDNAVMSSGAVSYTVDAPKIKLARPYLNFVVAHVINDDEMIITPLVSDWSVLEGQIIDITVDRMFDIYGNRQSSPITWSTYVRRNEVTWFVADGTQRLTIDKQANEAYRFEVTILNKGGKRQPYSIENIPEWLSTSYTSGTLEPNSSIIIYFDVAPELTIGYYSLDLFLSTDFNFDEKILLDLRVLGESPEWEIDPSDFEYNLNMIGKIKIDGAFSQDPYSKVAAFAGYELRGVANLAYDKDYDEYFLYLNVFSNNPSGEEITFKIWDASQGKILQATIDGSPSFTFIKNEVVGYKSVPVVFENTSFIEQYLTLNEGWTWISVFAEDPDLSDLNALTASMVLTDYDMVKSQLFFDVYDRITGWDGSLSNAGGLTPYSMYKFKLANANNLILGGNEVDASGWTVNVNAGWNWLGYPLSNNVSINEALALLEASEGDVIKNQGAFAIYDPLIGWTGTLTYMAAGEGYMLKSGIAQGFSYPNIFQSTGSGRISQITNSEIQDWASYEHNMNVVTEVLANEDYNAVWAIDRVGNARGRSEIIDIQGRKLGFMTIFGNNDSEDDLLFFLENQENKLATSVNFTFSPNNMLGTINQPILLEVAKGKFSVYPNAFTKDIHLRFNAINEQEAEVRLFNVLGHEVYRKSHNINKGSNEWIINPDVPKGLYVLSLTLDYKKITRKVIRK